MNLSSNMQLHLAFTYLRCLISHDSKNESIRPQSPSSIVLMISSCNRVMKDDDIQQGQLTSPKPPSTWENGIIPGTGLLTLNLRIGYIYIYLSVCVYYFFPKKNLGTWQSWSQSMATVSHRRRDKALIRTQPGSCLIVRLSGVPQDWTFFHLPFFIN